MTGCLGKYRIFSITTTFGIHITTVRLLMVIGLETLQFVDLKQETNTNCVWWQPTKEQTSSHHFTQRDFPMALVGSQSFHDFPIMLMKQHQIRGQEDRPSNMKQVSKTLYSNNQTRGNFELSSLNTNFKRNLRISPHFRQISSTEFRGKHLHRRCRSGMGSAKHFQRQPQENVPWRVLACCGQVHPPVTPPIP